MTMWIKICGNTNLEDARAAVEAGADALGFIFAPSKRRISPKEAATIVAALPRGVEKIGVFLNQAPELVLETVEKAALDGVQLHGRETPEYARELLARRPGLRLFKGLHLTDPDSAMREAAVLGEGGLFRAVLLDSGSAELGGGTGKAFNWKQGAPVARFVARKFKVIVSGGLTAANVGKAIEAFQPWGVDVASGVESEPGKKDHDKLRAFLAAARSGEAATENG